MMKSGNGLILSWLGSRIWVQQRINKFDNILCFSVAVVVINFLERSSDSCNFSDTINNEPLMTPHIPVASALLCIWKPSPEPHLQTEKQKRMNLSGWCHFSPLLVWENQNPVWEATMLLRYYDIKSKTKKKYIFSVFLNSMEMRGPALAAQPWMEIAGALVGPAE